MELVLILSVVFISFFILFVLSNNDFVLLRKSVTTVMMYDLAFLSIIFAFVFSRLFYIIDAQSFELIHFLKFFYFMKYEGLSLFGFFLGGVIAVSLFFRGKEALSRMYDIFLLSFFPVYIAAATLREYPENLFFARVGVLVLLIILFFAFLRFHNRYSVRDGSVALLFILLISLESLGTGFFEPGVDLVAGLSLTQIISILAFIISGVLFIVNQRYFRKGRNGRR